MQLNIQSRDVGFPLLRDIKLLQKNSWPLSARGYVQRNINKNNSKYLWNQKRKMKTFEYSLQFTVCVRSQRNMGKAWRKIEKKRREWRKGGKRENLYSKREQDKESKREGQEVQFYEHNKVSPGSYFVFAFAFLRVQFNSMVHSIFTELGIHHYYLILEHFITPKNNIVITPITPLFLAHSYH